MPLESLKIQKSGVRASFRPDSYSESGNTVDIVIATETEAIRTDWDGARYIEVLAVSPDTVRTERLANGNVSLIDTHYAGSVNSVFGRFVGFRFEGSELVGTVLLSSRSEVAGIITDVKNGVLKNCSVGYDIHEAILAGERSDIPIVRIIDWEPKEVSLCAVNVDMHSGVRSEKREDFTTISFTNTIENQMPETVTTQPAATEGTNPAPVAQDAGVQPAAAAPATPAPTAATVDAGRSAVAMERQRVTDILSAVRAANLGEDFANPLIEQGVSIDTAREKILNKLAEGSRANATASHNSGASVGRDRELEGRREAMTDALVLRAMPGEKLSDERRGRAMEYRSLSLFDLARQSAERAGFRTSDYDKLELVKRAITSSTSDFPVLLDGTARRVLLANYNAVADTWRRFCRIGSVSDFREWKRLRMGTLGNLAPVNENGEFKNKKISDADYEKISVQTWGDIINVSRQMIVNDDLDGFANLASMQGRAAARTIESRVYAMFAENSGNGPTMADGNPLFHASHKNIAATAAAPSVTSFDAVRQQMKQQMDKDSNDYLDITPSIWLGPSSLYGEATVLNDAQYDVNVTNKFQVPNRVRGMFKDIIDTPRLSGTAWYALAAVAEEPVFEVAFLDGQQTPYMETEQGFDVDGMRWKTRLDFDTAAIGWRGIVKNAGA